MGIPVFGGGFVRLMGQSPYFINVLVTVGWLWEGFSLVVPWAVASA